MRVLVIDDTAEIREMINKMLSVEGYDVLEAANGKEGMQIISNEPEIDLVITDLIMPEKEGIETIREIKQDYSHIRILAISGGGKIDSQNYLAIAKGMGADLTLSKPFVKQDLLKAVQELSVEK
ncbi:MAG: response regulator [Desulfobacterales bacterium]|nr:response regulator [Desulfobacterales bacterium]